jgi:hypothetical protein
MADATPQFALYVSSVEGRLTSRPGSPHSYIGARVRSPEEVQRGETEPLFFPEQVVPVQVGEYRRFLREWDKLIRNGDLVAKTADDFAAYQKGLEDADKARAAELEKQAKAEADAKAKAEKEAKKSAAPAADQGGA